MFLAHDAACFDGNYLAKRTISDKILKEIAYEIARICRYDEYQRAVTSMVYNFFDKKTKSWIKVNEQLAEEPHKPVVNFKDNVWAADIA